MRNVKKLSNLKARDVQRRLKKLGNPEHAAISQRFFKTGPGEYGEGDIFIGIRVPVLRKLVKEFKDLATREVEILLRSPIHEERLLAILLLVYIFNKGEDEVKKDIYDLYLKSTEFINNWDLVDVSAEHIVGAYLKDKNRALLYRLAGSKDLWERRISIMATFHFVKHREFSETIKICSMLLSDRHDLIHKACGWMLREIGKRDLKTEETFLKEHYRKMPRTMLRYAIEKFPENKRQRYLRGRI
ncbi:MAG: DNA alkylation repair protein [Proteobacteria bacterium]|nr:DNA alkylation repair protein [Pseudomonadota bacterium]